jgi:hypothetical protein
VIVSVRRVLYCLRGDIVSGAGPIELVFSDGSVVVLDAGSDGEELAQSTSCWVDAFAPPLSAENQRFVDESGKWTAFDVSGQAPYSRLVGAAVEGVEVHVTPSGKVVGTTIRAGNVVVRAEVEADDLIVDVV